MVMLARTRKLLDALEYSRRQLEPFRRNRYAAIREYTGAHYGDNSKWVVGNDDRVPINMIELAVNIYRRQLVAQRPRALTTTKIASLRPRATNFGMVLNDILGEIRIEQSLREGVGEALMSSMGITKVGWTVQEDNEIHGFEHDAGQPFADSISFDDWVHDMTATRWDQIQYAGNRFRIPFDVFKEGNLYKSTDIRTPDNQSRTYNEPGDPRSEGLQRGMEAQLTEFRDTIELWDIWLPAEDVLLTIHQPTGTIVRQLDWDGPEGGPYHRLGFGDVPGNVMPLPPVALWMDLHLLGNMLFRKLGRQAERQKTIGVVGPGADEDGKRIVEASDGEVIRNDMPGQVGEVKSGGIDPTSLAFLLQVRDLFSYFGGNLDALGGLSPQSETLGQDQLLTASAASRIRDMQDAVNDWVRGIFRHIGWYEWENPTTDRHLVKKIDGFNVEVPVHYTNEQKEGNLYDYNIDIEPFSLQSQTPGQKLNTVMTVLERMVFPVLPQAEQQGVAPDLRKLLELAAQYTNTPELAEILTLVEPGQPRDGSDRPRQSPVTRRVNERVNRPGGTRQGRDDAMARLLLGGGNQPSANASLMKGTG